MTPAPPPEPLLGLQVVVTRPAGQGGSLAERLARLGAEPVPLPAIEVVDPGDGGAALGRAAAAVGAYHWVAFTSVNAVGRFVALLGRPPGTGGARVAAIGPATADALGRAGLGVDLVPPRFVAESLVEAFPPPAPGGGRVLLPRAAAARDVLPEGLRAAGWEVDVVEAYRTVRARPDAEAQAAARRADIITFTSPSTVSAVVELLGDGLPPVVACIGPVTAGRARALGLAVDVEADVHTEAGLVAALVTVLSR